MKRKTAFILICALLCTMLSSLTMAEAAETSIKDGTVTVSTQTGVNKYIDNDNVQTMIVKTSRTKTITIPTEEGTEDKRLIIEAPNATIKNKAELDEIVVNDSRKYVEYATGNSIVVNDNDANIVLYKKAAVEELTVNSDTALITVQKSAKAESIVCTAENAEITIDTSSKSRLNVTVPEGVEPLIEGTYASKVRIAEVPAAETENEKKEESGDAGTDESVIPENKGEAEKDTAAEENKSESEQNTETQTPDTTITTEENNQTGPSFDPAYWIEGINTCIYSTYEFAASAESQEDLLLILNDYRIDNPFGFSLPEPVSAKKTEGTGKYIIKGYDAYGNLTHKVSIEYCDGEMGVGDSRYDYFYDNNQTLRIKREYEPCYSANEDGSNKRVTIIIYEVNYDESGKKTYACTHNPNYIIKIYYDEDGNNERDVIERVNGAF